MTVYAYLWGKKSLAAIPQSENSGLNVIIFSKLLNYLKIKFSLCLLSTKLFQEGNVWLQHWDFLSHLSDCPSGLKILSKPASGRQGMATGRFWTQNNRDHREDMTTRPGGCPMFFFLYLIRSWITKERIVNILRTVLFRKQNQPTTNKSK